MTQCRLDHEHKHGGSYKCYADGGCRCAPCKKRNADYARERNKQIAYGRWDTGLVDAAPVREHIQMLQAHGYGVIRIVKLAGVPSAAVNRCVFPLHGKLSMKIKRSTAEKVMALQPDTHAWADGAKVSPVGTRRRVQALVCMGWSMSELARRLGVEKWNFWKMVRAEHVLASTHRSVAALYDELWNQTPPAETATRAKMYAAARAWVPPLGWDDIDADPKPKREREGVIRGDELIDEIDHLVSLGESPDHIAKALKRSAGNLERHAWRYQRNDLASMFNQAAKREAA